MSIDPQLRGRSAAKSAFGEIDPPLAERLTLTSGLRDGYETMLRDGTCISNGVAGTVPFFAEPGAVEDAYLAGGLVLALTCYTPILGLVTTLELARLAEACLTRIQPILEAWPLPVAPSTAPAHGTSQRIDKVASSYDGRVRVLGDISFEAPVRSFRAVVGASGAGKSTLLRLIPRFPEPRGRLGCSGGDAPRQMVPSASNRSGREALPTGWKGDDDA